jgi:hypothetical protein
MMMLVCLLRQKFKKLRFQMIDDRLDALPAYFSPCQPLLPLTNLHFGYTSPMCIGGQKARRAYAQLSSLAAYFLPGCGGTLSWSESIKQPLQDAVKEPNASARCFRTFLSRKVVGDAPRTMIQDSVNRIDWVLREVLPQLSENNSR